MTAVATVRKALTAGVLAAGTAVGALLAVPGPTPSIRALLLTALGAFLVAAVGVFSTPNAQSADALGRAAAKRYAALPDRHPTGKRTGARITHDHRDYRVSDLRPGATADVSRVWRSITDWPMFLNDRLGDCTIAGLLHLYQILYAIAGLPAPSFTDDTALTLYEVFDGYVPGKPSTDRGGDPRQVLLDAQQHTHVLPESLGDFASVPINLTAIRAALRQYGALYSALYLPDDYARMGFRWIIQRSYQPDPDEGHLVILVMDGEKFYAITWGGIATVSEGFVLEYFQLLLAVEGLAS